MSDVTRDEIRKAAEAVGWGWDEDDIAGWCVWDETTPTRGSHVPRFVQGDEAVWDADSLALLEATGEPSQVRCAPRNRITKYAVTINGRAWHYAPTLPTAAVRAVNAWAESKKSP